MGKEKPKLQVLQSHRGRHYPFLSFVHILLPNYESPNMPV